MCHAIEVINEKHPRWLELKAFIEANQLGRHGVYTKDEDRCLITATVENEISGLLMFLVQPIGPEAGCPALLDSNGDELTEAKIRYIFVAEACRGRGIGTALQREAIVQASIRGVYQVRSRSDISRRANYSIKLKLGYAASPETTEVKDDSQPEGVRQTQSFVFIKRVDVDS